MTAKVDGGSSHSSDDTATGMPSLHHPRQIESTFSVDMDNVVDWGQNMFELPLGSFEENKQTGSDNNIMRRSPRGSPSHLARSSDPMERRGGPTPSSSYLPCNPASPPRKHRQGAPFMSPGEYRHHQGAPHPYHSYMYPHHYYGGGPPPPPHHHHHHHHREHYPSYRTGDIAPPAWPSTSPPEVSDSYKQPLSDSSRVGTDESRLPPISQADNLSTPVKSAASVFRRHGLSPSQKAKKSPLSQMGPSFSFTEPLDSFTLDTPGKQLGDFSPMAQPDLTEGLSSYSATKHTRKDSGGGLYETSPFSGFIQDFAAGHPLAPSDSKTSCVPSPMVKSSAAPSTGSTAPSTAPKSSRGPYPPPKTLRSSPLVTSTGAEDKLRSRNTSETKPRRLWKGNETKNSTPAMRIELLGGQGTTRSLEQLNSRMRVGRSSSGDSSSKGSSGSSASGRDSKSTPPSSGSKMATPSYGRAHSTPKVPPSSSYSSGHSSHRHPGHPGAPITHPPPPRAPHHPPYSHHHASRMPHNSMHTPLKSTPHSHGPTHRGAPPHHSRIHSAYFPTSSMVSPMPTKGPVVAKENSGDKQLPPCKCKKSKCLKLYCDCFGANALCHAGCKCTDCHNKPGHEEARNKAIREIRAKNPNAFKPRLEVATEKPGEGVHNMGCKCSKTGCLKKYCECFKGGILCSAKCKCQACNNYAGSQKLIDARRKMKDVKGAEFAMQAAHEVWRAKPTSVPSASKPPAPNSSIRPKSHMHESPARHTPLGQQRPYYMRPPHPYTGRSTQTMDFSPLGTRGSHARDSGHNQSFAQHQRHHSSSRANKGLPMTAEKQTSSVKRRASSVSPSVATVNSDESSTGSSSRKKMKMSKADEKDTKPDSASSKKSVQLSTSPLKQGASPEQPKPEQFFGTKLPCVPKKIALRIFSFLSSDDVQQATLVCKAWGAVSQSSDMWKLPQSK